MWPISFAKFDHLKHVPVPDLGFFHFTAFPVLRYKLWFQMFILTFLLQLCSYLQLILFLCFGVEELPVCKVGLSFMQDHSGKCFKRKGTAAVSLKDVQSNKEATCLSCVKCNYQFCNASYKHHSQVVCAVIQVPKGRRYVSKHLMASAVICFYKRHKLFPQGLHSKLPCVEEWAAKQGLAIARLVPLLCY